MNKGRVYGWMAGRSVRRRMVAILERKWGMPALDAAMVHLMEKVKFRLLI